MQGRLWIEGEFCDTDLRVQFQGHFGLRSPQCGLWKLSDPKGLGCCCCMLHSFCKWVVQVCPATLSCKAVTPQSAVTKVKGKYKSVLWFICAGHLNFVLYRIFVCTSHCSVPFSLWNSLSALFDALYYYDDLKYAVCLFESTLYYTQVCPIVSVSVVHTVCVTLWDSWPPLFCANCPVPGVCVPLTRVYD